MAAAEPLQARFATLHNLSMALVAAGMVGAALLHFAGNSGELPEVSLSDPRFVLFAALAAALVFYTYVGLSRFVNRTPQVVIDRDGIALGFGRNRRFGWREIQWVRLHRLSFRAQLQIALVPEAFVGANLNLSPWNLDDGLRPVRGVPAAVLVRDNGLDTSAAAMLDAVRRFRPNLVKP